MKKILTAVTLCTVFAVNTNASRWEVNYLHDKTHAHYCALCFTKAEAEDFKGKLTAVSLGSASIAGIVAAACPAAAPLSATIGGVIAGSSGLINAIISWNTSKGTGFSINIPSKMLFPAQYGNEHGFMGLPLVPFVWESEG